MGGKNTDLKGNNVEKYKKPAIVGSISFDKDKYILIKRDKIRYILRE